jgi:transcriptional regulator with XRE-family HTH domain
MNFFGQLKERKDRLGKNLSMLAGLTGMSAPHISNILNGLKDAQASSLDALADAMDAKWVLVPKHLLPELERLLSGKTIAPDDVPSTVDRLFGRDADE